MFADWANPTSRPTRQNGLDEAASPRAGGAVWVGFPFCVALTSPQFGSGILELPAGVTGILWLHTRKGITMTELRKRMIRDLQLAGLVRSTQREYLRGVRQLAASYMVSPDQLTEREVEDFLFYVRDELCVARGTFATIWAGLKFFYLNTLGYDWPLFTKKKSASHAEYACPPSVAMRIAAA